MMEEQKEFDLSQVQLADATRYLVENGWRQIKYVDDRIDVYTKQDPQTSRSYKVTLPKSQEMIDYAGEMEETLRRLALVEKTTISAILRKIQTQQKDIVLLRMVLEHDEYPSVERTMHLIEGIRELLSWGWCMEQRQQRFFPRLFFPTRGQPIAERFKLAHTQQGSFGFTFESELPAGLFTHRDSADMQRRVLERITRGFLSTRQAEGSPQGAGEISSQYVRGFNSNMCNAALQMLEDMQHESLYYSVRWSKAVEVDEDLAAFEPVHLSVHSLPYLKQAATEMERQGREDIAGVQTLEGPVVSLSYDGQGAREVIILVETRGKVRLELEEGLYHLAGEAHLRGQDIRVTGTLSRENRRGPLHLSNPRDFAVVEEEEPLV